MTLNAHGRATIYKIDAEKANALNDLEAKQLKKRFQNQKIIPYTFSRTLTLKQFYMNHLHKLLNA